MKIGKLLTKLVAELNSKLAEAPFIELANISSLDGGAESSESRSSIILSVINIEENKELKNQIPHHYSPTIASYQQDSTSLVLSLLFTSCHTDQSKYADGLDKLDDITAYFRKNSKLYLQDSNITQTSPSNGSYDIMVLSMVNQKTDQLSQVWSYLGSKYQPSLLYQLQIISFEEENILPPGGIISI